MGTIRRAHAVHPITSVETEYSSLFRDAQAVTALRELATQKGCTMGQVCLAWVLAQRPYIVPIPGIGNRRHLTDNIAAIDVTLTAIELQQLNDWFAPANIQGDRYGAFDTALVEQP